MRDNEGNVILLSRECNGHILVLGQSGQGKTYFLCRQMEEAVKQGEHLFAFDYSGSYSEHELMRQRFKYINSVCRLDVKKNMIVSVPEDKLQDIVGAITESLGIHSYFQMKLLEEAVENTIEKNKRMSFPKLCETLETMLQKEQCSESVNGNTDNLGRLLTRLYPLRGLEHFEIAVAEKAIYQGLTIFDFTGVPMKIRKILSELCIALLWHCISSERELGQTITFVLDELQYLSCAENSSLAALLREGRKFDVSVLMATQFINNYENGQLQVLLQAANLVIFKPTVDEIVRVAKCIDRKKCKDWEKILGNLRRGEAVLKGIFFVNGRKYSQSAEVIVRI